MLAAYGLAPDTPETETVAHLFKLYAAILAAKWWGGSSSRPPHWDNGHLARCRDELLYDNHKPIRIDGITAAGDLLHLVAFCAQSEHRLSRQRSLRRNNHLA